MIRKRFREATSVLGYNWRALWLWLTLVYFDSTERLPAWGMVEKVYRYRNGKEEIYHQ